MNRWRRFGNDRLYVSRGDGVKVGWWDLKAGKGGPETPADEAALIEAVTAWQTRQRADDLDAPDLAEAAMPTVGASSIESAPTNLTDVLSPSLAVEAARPWLDLSTNLPGAEAREQAVDNPRWRFLHAIPVGARGADIDHLVIGPGGVFTVNAKHHPRAQIWVGGDTFMVNGHKQPYIRNSRHEAARTAKLLTTACGFPVHVEGVVVMVNAEDVVVKKAPAGVHVVPRMQVAKWLARHGDSHSAPALDAIFDAARRSTTWRS